MAKSRDLTGKTISGIYVIKRTDDRINNTRRRVYYECRCHCGRVWDVYGGTLISGRTRGCLVGVSLVGMTISSTSKKPSNQMELWNEHP